MSAQRDPLSTAGFLNAVYLGFPETEHISIFITQGDNPPRMTFLPSTGTNAVISAVTGNPDATAVYFRVCTMRDIPGKGRGDAIASTMLPGFWADIDLSGPNHAKQGEFPLPDDEDDARAIISNSSLPEPSLWVFTGGGYHAYWLLSAPLPITDANRSDVAQLSVDVQRELQRSARDLGMEYDPSVGDLSRLLRVPGTMNRKQGEPTLCEVIEFSGDRFTHGGIRSAVPQSTPLPPMSSAGGSAPGFLDRLPSGQMCPAMERKLNRWAEELKTTSSGGRHSVAARSARGIITTANFGHTGGVTALDTLESVFLASVADDRGARPDEWPGIVSWAVNLTEERTAAERSCCGELEFTDEHLSSLFVKEELTDNYLWANALGWLVWDGIRWASCSDESLSLLTKQWIRGKFDAARDDAARISRDVADLIAVWSRTDNEDENPEDAILRRRETAAKRLAASWRKYLSASKIGAVLSLAKLEVLLTDISRLDANPDLLNTPSGVVNLKTGALEPHDPDLMMTRVTAVDYVPGYTSPMFDVVLSAVPEDSRSWLQLKIGQAVTGYPQINDPNVFMKGGGRNGKTMFLSTFFFALGGSRDGSYASQIPARVLTGERSHNEMMELLGCRFAFTEELPENARINTEALKAITDSKTLQGRRLYKDLVTWEPTHSLFVTTNLLPQMSETTDAVWRRVALLSFPYTYVKERRELAPNERRADSRIPLQMEDEKNGVCDPELFRAALSWAVDGARKFFRLGREVPMPPASVLDATRGWRQESDYVLAFWDGVIIPDAGSHITTSDLYDAFTEWRERRGDKPLSSKVFIPAFELHEETRKNRVWRDRVRTGSVETSRSVYKGTRGSDGGSEFSRIWSGVRFRGSCDDDPFTE